MPSHAIVPTDAKATALDASALFVGAFDALFFGGMISSSNTHGGRQCLGQGLQTLVVTQARKMANMRLKRNKMNDFIKLVFPL
jgi:hypothetical protein